jgi:hypothetical protein
VRLSRAVLGRHMGPLGYGRMLVALSSPALRTANPRRAEKPKSKIGCPDVCREGVLPSQPAASSAVTYRKRHRVASAFGYVD